ncbi:MAG: Gldg family protein [Caldilineales bacterium]|nr:Gldg family protein [Caldilineales bacterium]MDW8318225.1 Gldg family protein [Anaerolineae bacterium]
MKQTLAIARKELNSYFSSPMALIFVAAFLALVLLTFFWVDTFFARGIADVRPLFSRMPLLMIFLVASLTMRQWSEEEQRGTLEMLLTLPVTSVQLVLGKFLAVMALVALALALTLFLPIMVAIVGNLDWGPVIGGYLAALLLAAAYAAMGLFVSSRTDNQIVALILTALLAGFFYLIGSPTVTDFAGGRLAEVLRSLGAGSRFQSIERGVIDLRDLVYYLSLTALFLALNVLSVESKRWSRSQQTRAYRGSLVLTVVLLAANLVALNLWLSRLSALRLDLTEQRQYSLSQPTRDLISGLSEPLLLRAYISEKTHPLLAPLAPQIADLMQEYAVASGGRVRVEVVDPVNDPDLEAEANQTYGIRPTPFQIAGRNETSVINSYFDILVRYGDQSEVLNFRDLIEVQARRDGTLDVRLRNPEYDLTRAIKKVVYGFQDVGAALSRLEQPARLTLFVTPNTLPEPLRSVPDVVRKVANDIAQTASGKLLFQQVDPDAAGSQWNRQKLWETYGIQPFAVSLFSPDSYYLHAVLEAGDQAQVIYLPGDVSEAELRTALEAGIKRASAGFLKVVGLWTPPETPTADMFGQLQQPISTYRTVREQLSQEYEVRDVDLNSGQVPAGVDTLVLVAPQGLSDRARYAVDQFLMRGGSVVMAAGNYRLTVDQFTGQVGVEPIADGVAPLLASYGITLTQALVMDPQNEPFPVPVVRNVGGFQVQEIQLINYPPFVDVRSDGMAQGDPIVANLPAVTLNWASPVELDPAKNEGRTATVLLQSSPRSWLRRSTNVEPDLQTYPELGFPVEGEQKRYPLAVAVQGRFQSAFRGQPMPPAADQADQSAPPEPMATVDQSPDTARLVVIGSGEFLNDTVFGISARLSGERYLNSLQLLQNAVDWSVEDLDLLAIRARGTSTRLLEPLSERQQNTWEAAAYLVALLAVAALGAFWAIRRRSEQPMALVPES